MVIAFEAVRRDLQNAIDDKILSGEYPGAPDESDELEDPKWFRVNKDSESTFYPKSTALVLNRSINKHDVYVFFITEEADCHIIERNEFFLVKAIKLYSQDPYAAEYAELDSKYCLNFLRKQNILLEL
jgi:hypothetical protein